MLRRPRDLTSGSQVPEVTPMLRSPAVSGSLGDQDVLEASRAIAGNAWRTTVREIERIELGSALC